MEDYTTGTGQRLKVHDLAICSAVQRNRGDCVIHRRKDTHMKGWPTHWRSDWGGFMEVICPHGIGHPAPEELRPGGFGHGCDGCCRVDYLAPPEAKPATPQSGYRYKPGGLMRCCLLTLAREYEQIAAGAVVHADGDRLPCAYCSSSMNLVDGAWEWDKSRAPVHGVPVPPEAELA